MSPTVNVGPNFDASGLRAQVNAVVDSMHPYVHIGASFDVYAALAEIEAAIEAMHPEVRVGIKFDKAEGLAAVKQIQALMRSQGLADFLDIDVPVGKIMAQLQLLKRMMNSVGLTDMLDVSLNKAQLAAQMAEIKTMMSALSESIPVSFDVSKMPVLAPTGGITEKVPVEWDIPPLEPELIAATAGDHVDIPVDFDLSKLPILGPIGKLTEKLEIDDSGALATIAALQARMAALSELFGNLRIDATDTAAEAVIAKLQAQLAALSKMTENIQLGADTTRLDTAIAAEMAKLAVLQARAGDLSIDFSSADLARMDAAIAAEIAKIGALQAQAADIRMNFTVDTAALAKADAQLLALEAVAEKISATPIDFHVNDAGLTAALAAMAAEGTVITAIFDGLNSALSASDRADMAMAVGLMGAVAAGKSAAVVFDGLNSELTANTRASMAAAAGVLGLSGNISAGREAIAGMNLAAASAATSEQNLAAKMAILDGSAMKFAATTVFARKALEDAATGMETLTLGAAATAVSLRGATSGWAGLLTKLTLFGGLMPGIAGHVQVFHVLLDWMIELAAVAIPAVVGVIALTTALGIFALVGQQAGDTFSHIYDRMMYLFYASQALGVSIPPLKGSFGALEGSIRPEIFTLLGEAMNQVSGQTTMMGKVALATGGILDRLGADLAVWFDSTSFTHFIDIGVADLLQFGRMWENLGSALAKFFEAAEITHIAEDFLEFFVILSDGIKWISQLPPWLIAAALALHGVWLWGGLVSTLLLKMIDPIRSLALAMGGLSKAGSALSSLPASASAWQKLGAAFSDVGSGIGNIIPRMTGASTSLKALAADMNGLDGVTGMTVGQLEALQLTAGRTEGGLAAMIPESVTAQLAELETGMTAANFKSLQLAATTGLTADQLDALAATLGSTGTSLNAMSAMSGIAVADLQALQATAAETEGGLLALVPPEVMEQVMALGAGLSDASLELLELAAASDVAGAGLDDLAAQLVVVDAALDATTADAGIASGAMKALSASFLASPVTWAIALAAALVFVSVEIIRAQDATQTWIESLDTAINKSGTFTAIGTTVSALAAVTQQLANVQQGAAGNAGELSAAQDDLSAKLGTELVHVTDISHEYGTNFVGALALLNAAQVTTGQLASSNTKTWAEAKVQVAGLVTGYKDMAIGIGEAENAVTVQMVVGGGSVLKAMGKLNTAWDSFATIVSAPISGVLTLASSLNTFATDSQAAGASMDGLAGVVRKDSDKMSSSSIQLQQDFQSTFGDVEQLFDSFRNAQAVSGGGNFIAFAKDAVAALIPLAGSNKAAASEISVLAQEAGGPATSSLTSLAKWAGNVKNPMTALYNASESASSQVSNLNLDAQALSQTLEGDLNPAMASAAFGALGGQKNFATFADDLQKFGPSSQITITAAGAVANELLAIDKNSNSAEAQFVGMAESMGYSKAAADKLWASAKRLSSVAYKMTIQDNIAAEQTKIKLLQKQISETANPAKKHLLELELHVDLSQLGKSEAQLKTASGSADKLRASLAGDTATGTDLAKSGFWGQIRDKIENLVGFVTKHPITTLMFGALNFIPGFTAAMDKAGGVISKFFTKTIPDAAKGAGGALSGAWSTAYQGFMKGFGSPVASWFTSAFPHAIASAWDSAWSGLVTPVVHAFDAVKSAITGGFDGWWKTHGAEVEQVWHDAVAKLKQDWDDFWGAAKAIFGVFRTAWDGFIGGLESAWKTLIGWFTGQGAIGKALEDTFKAAMSVITPIVSVGIDAVELIFKVGWDLISGVTKIAWDVIVAIVKSVWDIMAAVVKIGIGAIEAVLKIGWDVLVGVFSVALDLITGHWGRAWTDIKTTGEQIWNAVSGFFSGAWGDLTTLFGQVIGHITTAWSQTWNTVKSTGVAIWQSIVSVLFDPMGNFFTKTLPGWWTDAATFFMNNFGTPLENDGKAIWNWISGTFGTDISNFFTKTLPGWWTDASNFFENNFITPFENDAKTVWNWISGTFGTDISNFFTKTIPGWFTTAVSAIGKAWDGLMSALATPVNWVITNVLQPLANAFNDITNALGLGKVIGPIPTIGTSGGSVPNNVNHSGAARGMKVTQGTGPTADDVLVRVSRGETIVSAADSQTLAPAFSAVGVPGYAGGGVPGYAGGGVPGYATGGIPGGGVVKDIKNVAGSVVSDIAGELTGAAWTALKQVIPGLGAVASLANLIAGATSKLDGLAGKGDDGAKGVMGRILTVIPKMAVKDMISWLSSHAKAAPAAKGGITGAGVSNSSAEAALQSAAAKAGWTGAEWTALYDVEMREAGFSLTATNQSSGAYGMAQFINGPSEYAEYGGNSTTAAGQAVAMVNYIKDRYGTPEAAWAHEEAYGWYAHGGKVTAGTGPTSDDVLARVSKGETIVSAADSQKLAPAFAALGVPGYAAGGTPTPALALIAAKKTQDIAAKAVTAAQKKEKAAQASETKVSKTETAASLAEAAAAKVVAHVRTETASKAQKSALAAAVSVLSHDQSALAKDRLSLAAAKKVLSAAGTGLTQKKLMDTVANKAEKSAESAVEKSKAPTTLAGKGAAYLAGKGKTTVNDQITATGKTLKTDTTLAGAKGLSKALHAKYAAGEAAAKKKLASLNTELTTMRNWRIELTGSDSTVSSWINAAGSTKDLTSYVAKWKAQRAAQEATISKISAMLGPGAWDVAPVPPVTTISSGGTTSTISSGGTTSTGSSGGTTSTGSSGGTTSTSSSGTTATAPPPPPMTAAQVLALLGAIGPQAQALGSGTVASLPGTTSSTGTTSTGTTGTAAPHPRRRHWRHHGWRVPRLPVGPGTVNLGGLITPDDLSDIMGAVNPGGPMIPAAPGRLSGMPVHAPYFSAGGRILSYDSGGSLPPGLSMSWNGTGKSETVASPGMDGQMDRLIRATNQQNSLLAQHMTLTRKLIDTTAAVPAGVGRSVGGAVSGAAQNASFRSRYARGGA